MELIFLTLDSGVAYVLILITAISTVCISIALPVSVNTLQLIQTGESVFITRTGDVLWLLTFL